MISFKRAQLHRKLGIKIAHWNRRWEQAFEELDNSNDVYTGYCERLIKWQNKNEWENLIAKF